MGGSDMYDFNNPRVIELPPSLDEISGITYYPKDTSLFAIVDEDGILYKFPLNNVAQTRSWQFYKARDFEDLVLIDSVFYVLVSSGDIVRVSFQNDKPVGEKIDLSSQNKSVNEFESMYVDGDSIIVLCKSCDADEKNYSSSLSYKYGDSVPAYKPHIKFDFSSIFSKSGKPEHLKASAATINPVTGDLYIISSIQQLIIITDKTGKIKSSYKLDPKIYKQPEGIAFTPEGDLIISNEFADIGNANLLLIKNKLKSK